MTNDPMSPTSRSSAPTAREPRPLDRARLRDLLADLFSRELDAQAGNEYLAAHAQPNSVLRQLDAFQAYLPHVPDGAKILDWGCCHAPDSVLLRETLGPGIELHGCDFDPDGRYPAFHRYAGLRYRELDDIVRLPYEREQFDVVVGSGVLEHAAMDLESLKELHRVIRDDGLLILSFLPNRLSYTEFLSRRLGRTAHRRLYGKRSAMRLLLHHGFEPIAVRYHQFIPGQQLQSVFGRLWPMNGVLERAWPTSYFCANLAVIARKRRVM